MKRAVLVITILFLGCTSFAQLTFGPKVGFTMSKLKTNFEEIKEEVKPGFQFGAFVRIGKKVYLQPELMFVTKGGIIKSEAGLNTKTKVNLSTIQVPVIAGYKLINLEVVNLRILAGPAFSFITNKELTISTDNGEQTIKDTNLKDAIWSFNLGAGVDVLMFTLDVRYEWGLNNIYDPQGGQDQDMKNNLWNVSLGWKIL